MLELTKKNSIYLSWPVDLDSINVDQIVVSDKLKHNGDGFKYFIGYKEDEIVLLCIIYYVLSYLKWVGT